MKVIKSHFFLFVTLAYLSGSVGFATEQPVLKLKTNRHKLTKSSFEFPSSKARKKPALQTKTETLNIKLQNIPTPCQKFILYGADSVDDGLLVWGKCPDDTQVNYGYKVDFNNQVVDNFTLRLNIDPDEYWGFGIAQVYQFNSDEYLAEVQLWKPRSFSNIRHFVVLPKNGSLRVIASLETSIYLDFTLKALNDKEYLVFLDAGRQEAIYTMADPGPKLTPLIDFDRGLYFFSADKINGGYLVRAWNRETRTYTLMQIAEDSSLSDYSNFMEEDIKQDFIGNMLINGNSALVYYSNKNLQGQKSNTFLLDINTASNSHKIMDESDRSKEIVMHHSLQREGSSLYSVVKNKNTKVSQIKKILDVDAEPLFESKKYIDDYKLSGDNLFASLISLKKYRRNVPEDTQNRAHCINWKDLTTGEQIELKNLPSDPLITAFENNAIYKDFEGIKLFNSQQPTINLLEGLDTTSSAIDLSSPWSINTHDPSKEIVYFVGCEPEDIEIDIYSSLAECNDSHRIYSITIDKEQLN